MLADSKELTHLDKSHKRFTNKLDNSPRRTSSEHEQETAIKHSAHAFLTPQTPSSHK